MATRGLILALLFAFSIPAQDATTVDPDPYAGSASCAPCHPAEYKSQSATGHAGSLAKAAEHRLADQFRPLIANRVPTPEWAFGGGIQAVTFVSRLDDASYLEHKLSYYRSTGKLASTPGHDDTPEPGVRYPLFGPSGAILRCFLCHSTGNPSVTGGVIAPAELGVRCETCHGPGKSHAAKPTLDNIVRPAAFTPLAPQPACGSCRKPAGDDTDFRNSWNARHQPSTWLKVNALLKAADSPVPLATPRTADPRNPLVPNVTRPPRTRPAFAPAQPDPAAKAVTCPSYGLSRTGFANHWIGIYPRGETLVPTIRP
ncbi:MAG: multiheme c-type cytochrome [Bryobacteraceae bacterium]